MKQKAAATAATTINQRYEQHYLNEQQKMAVAQLWLRGYTVEAIVERLSITQGLVLDGIRDMRQLMLEQHRQDIDIMAAERIEGFRQIQREAWDRLEGNLRQGPQLLSIVIKAEENIAKIQGVLTDKTHHLVEVVHPKLYDFTDRFPDAIAIGSGVEAVEEAEVIVIEDNDGG